MRYDKEDLDRYEERISKMPAKELLHEVRQAHAVYPRPPIGTLTVLEILAKGLVDQSQARKV